MISGLDFTGILRGQGVDALCKVLGWYRKNVYKCHPKTVRRIRSVSVVISRKLQVMVA